jgi:hypothetical protein
LSLVLFDVALAALKGSLLLFTLYHLIFNNFKLFVVVLGSFGLDICQVNRGQVNANVSRLPAIFFFALGAISFFLLLLLEVSSRYGLI